MRALLQRVSEASVAIDGEVISHIGAGLLIFLGVAEGDDEVDTEFLLRKIPSLRIFEDDSGKMNRSLLDVKGAALVVSQFTLLADTSGGNRPSFFRAGKPAAAESMYKNFVARLRMAGVPVSTGRFGADMKVRLLNDGPVTILLDTKEV